MQRCRPAPAALTAVPLITKGRHDQDGTTEDTNYFLGLDADRPHRGRLRGLRRDRTTTTRSPGRRSVTHERLAPRRRHLRRQRRGGSTSMASLDGTSPALTPRRGSTRPQHAAIATSLDDAAVEVPEGFFQGQMDEVRIWNVARTPAQIAAAYQLEIPSATGLLGRYSMNEGLGTAVGDSSGTPQNGTTVGGPTWVQGYTFQVGTPERPAGGRLRDDQPGFAAHQRHPVGDGDEPRPEQRPGQLQLPVVEEQRRHLRCDRRHAEHGDRRQRRQGRRDPRPCRGQRRPRRQRTGHVLAGHRAQHDPGGLGVDRRHDPRLQRRDHGHRDAERPRR